MICCVDTSNIFFICWAMFKKECFAKNGEDYIIKEEDLGLFWHMFLRKLMPYITNYKDCRKLISKIEREKIVERLLKSYLKDL